MSELATLFFSPAWVEPPLTFYDLILSLAEASSLIDTEEVDLTIFLFLFFWCLLMLLCSSAGALLFTEPRPALDCLFLLVLITALLLKVLGLLEDKSEIALSFLLKPPPASELFDLQEARVAGCFDSSNPFLEVERMLWRRFGCLLYALGGWYSARYFCFLVPWLALNAELVDAPIVAGFEVTLRLRLLL